MLTMFWLKSRKKVVLLSTLLVSMGGRMHNRKKNHGLLKYLQTFVVGPWVLIGDFNAYLQISKKKSARQLQFSQIEAFGETLSSCQLQDLGFKRYPYTWSNKRPGEANTKIRLDRGVANKEWTDRFQLSKIVHLLTHE